MFCSSLGLARQVGGLALLVGMAVLPLGCSGGGKASISGKVDYKGAPVTGGAMTLTPATGTAIAVPLKADGTFALADVPLGTYTVSFNTDGVPEAGLVGPPDSPGERPADITQGKGMPKPEIPEGKAMMLRRVAIPAKYKDPKTSGETWEIKRGKNKKDFNLQD